MRESNAGDLSFLNSILGQGAELGVYPPCRGDGLIDCAAVFEEELPGYSGWVVAQEAEQRTPGESARAALREEGASRHIRGRP